MGPQAPKLAGGQVSTDSEGENPLTGNMHCQAPSHTLTDLLLEGYS